MEMYIGFGLLIAFNVYLLYKYLQLESSFTEFYIKTNEETQDLELKLRHSYVREQTLYNFLPLLEALHEKDIKLVIETDYPRYEIKHLDIRDADVAVVLEKESRPELRLFKDDHYIEVISLSEVKSRAEELRDLKSKLCKSKCKKDK